MKEKINDLVTHFYYNCRLFTSHAQRNYYIFQNAMGENEMKFEYTITKEGGEKETMQAMSWKKLFKSLLVKYPKFSGWCSYMNKHGNHQVRAFIQGKEVRK